MRFSPQLRALDWLVAKPIAHRGLHNKAAGVLENTSSAFAAAIENNYAIECDLQLTADGEAIVFHDHVLDRVIDGSGHVNAFTTREIKALKYRIGNDTAQTLGDLLDQVCGQVTLVIEIKSLWNDDATLALRALKVLQSYSGPYCLMSFDPDIVAFLAEVSPRTVRGIVADRTIDPVYQLLPMAKRLEMRSFSHLPSTRPHFASFDYKELPFAPVQKIRAAGHPVLSWTIKSEAAAQMARRYSDQITFESYLA
jgi:glycerophosphoryl diester phosphodiesterase